MYETLSTQDVAEPETSRLRSFPPRPRARERERFSFDQGYLDRLIAGDAATERHFGEYFGELLLIKLRARLRDSQAVEDLRQEVFLRVLAAVKIRGTLQRAECLGAYVNAVSENVLLEHYRKDSRVAEWEEGFDPPDQRRNAEWELVNEERRRQVRRVLGELPEKDRDLLRMVFYDEADPDEICRSYAVTRDYLRVLVHRAKARFRAGLLREQGTPTP